MDKKIFEEMIKQITFISGILNLTRADLSKKPIILPKSQWDESVIIKKTQKGLKIFIGIIVDVEIRSIVIAYEIVSSLKDLFKKNDININNIIIYIRGVK